MDVSATDQVRQALVDLGWVDAAEVQWIGAGAWSNAYSFRLDADRLVVRIGSHEADFRRDQTMAAYRRPGLPIPAVHGVGPLPGGDGLSYCISDLVPGTPLDDCAIERWPAVAESLVDALEVMRSTKPPDTLNVAPWKTQLLATEYGQHDERLRNWRTRLTVRARASFHDCVSALESLDLSSVPLSLIHGDLINKNVHIERDAVTGIFDWGCQRWGDHLFELAWFEMWAPWHPNLDFVALRQAMDRRWSQAEYEPTDVDTRRRAALLQIVIDHLAYNAAFEKWSDLDATIDRIEELDLL